ncbi:uncharacterized protein KZ484_006579 isoform 1-T1 [Pholidichthys leucotaenia]
MKEEQHSPRLGWSKEATDCWIAAVRRPNITFKHTPVSMVVCSKHFHKGCGALSGAKTLKCSVTHTDQKYVYTITDFASLDQSGTSKYYWSNGSNHMIATNSEKADVVLEASNSTLITSECLAGVFLKLHYTTRQNKPEDYEAKCEAVCPAPVVGDQDRSLYWLFILVPIILLPLAGLGFWFRRNPRSVLCSDGQDRDYSSVEGGDTETGL